VNFHSLRHTAATILASRRTPPGSVHRILGHTSFATTMKLYGGFTAEALESAAGTLADAFEPRPDKRFSVSREKPGKSLIERLPGLDLSWIASS
jgi:Phage integrase family